MALSVSTSLFVTYKCCIIPHHEHEHEHEHELSTSTIMNGTVHTLLYITQLRSSFGTVSFREEVHRLVEVLHVALHGGHPHAACRARSRRLGFLGASLLGSF